MPENLGTSQGKFGNCRESRTAVSDRASGTEKGNKTAVDLGSTLRRTLSHLEFFSHKALCETRFLRDSKYHMGQFAGCEANRDSWPTVASLAEIERRLGLQAKRPSLRQEVSQVCNQLRHAHGKQVPVQGLLFGCPLSRGLAHQQRACTWAALIKGCGRIEASTGVENVVHDGLNFSEPRPKVNPNVNVNSLIQFLR